MTGKRIYPDDLGHLPILQRGEYGRDGRGRWFAFVPFEKVFAPVHLNCSEYPWIIEEHPDGTISVTPSIICYDGNNIRFWHGHLTKGVWSEC